MSQFPTKVGPSFALAVLMALTAVGASADGPAPRENRFFQTCYMPPHDANAGELYEEAAALLDRARELPERIRLQTSLSGAGEPDEPEAGEAEAPEPSPAWVQVVSRPVGSSERRAYVLVRAGHWTEGRRIYRELYARNPGDRHATVMLALCEYRCGDFKEARRLLGDVAKKETSLTPWLEWVESRVDSSTRGKEPQ